MPDPFTSLTAAITNSAKVANTPIFSTVIDRMLGYKISQWKAEGDAIKKHISDGYEEAKQKGLGIQYVSSFRESANLINMGSKAAKYIDGTKTDEVPLENDFFWGMIGHAKYISNDEMQELIAKIIAGEYNKPGTYSMSTLQVIKMLGKYELELFEKICSLIINDDQIPQDLFSLPQNAMHFMKKLGVDFGSLQMLQSLGLFFPNDMRKTMENPNNRIYRVNYFDENIDFVAVNPEDVNNLGIEIPNFYGLTPVGRQILQHLDPQSSIDYLKWLKENYRIPNYQTKN